MTEKPGSKPPCGAFSILLSLLCTCLLWMAARRYLPKVFNWQGAYEVLLLDACVIIWLVLYAILKHRQMERYRAKKKREAGNE